MSDYNGWTNYATWRVNLELFDGLEPECFGLDSGEELKLTDVGDFADALKDYAEEAIIGANNNRLTESYALAFMADVNWYEIAKHKIEEFAE